MFPDVPESVEARLVDCLTYGGALDALCEVAEARAGTVFRNFDHMLSWLAIEVLVRFDAVRSNLDGTAQIIPNSSGSSAIGSSSDGAAGRCR